MFFINRLTFIAHKIIIFIYEREKPMSMRIRKLLPAVFMAAALTLTIPVSIYAAEDDNQTIQSQITRPVLYTVSISRIQLMTMSLALSKPKLSMKTQPCEN